jgi:alcohol dehydrogenase
MWTFTLPTKIQFGVGVSRDCAQVAREYGSRPVVVTGKTLIGTDRVREIIAELGDVPVFAEVTPNPTVQQVDALTRLIREEHCDSVIAIGGGSPLDCAKAASALAPSSESGIRAFLTGGRQFGRERLPLIAVPTTSGTGSEVTPIAVLDDPDAGTKAPVAGPALYPAHALVDPELTLSLPRFTTVATALDALSHALEGYWSKNHQPICDLAAIEAARRIFANLERVCEAPDNLEARAELSYAALLAGMAFQLPKNAMVHACSFPLSTRYHLAHGAACAFTLEFAVQFNAPALGERFSDLARACGFSSATEMAARIHAFKRLGGLPCTLADAGIPADAIPDLVQASFHPLMNNNPREVTKEDLGRMYGGLT